ncbi:MAG TPA: response regulator [Bacteroidales bacterium]|nr:response regulator [Bacteroidales bacterium]
MKLIENPAILVVDDHKPNVDIVIGILKSENYNIIPAYSGHEALEKIKTLPVDLILLDIMMPKMNGFEVCKRIREDVKYKDIPIIFLSALDEPEDIVLGFTLGGNDYLSKPFRKEELIARVKNYIELKKAKDMIKKQLNDLKEANRFILGVLHQYSKYVEQEQDTHPPLKRLRKKK